MKRLSIGFLLANLLLLLAACNSGSVTEVWADDYDRNCSTPADCAVVTEGNLCKCAGDGISAINESALDDFSRNADAARDACGDELEVCGSLVEERAHQEASPLPRVALCEAGTCVGKWARDVEGSVENTVDRTCETDSDCTTAPAVFDQPCGCKVAVSREGRDTAELILSDKETNLDQSCECGSAGVGAKCVSGYCHLTEDTCEVTGWIDQQCENP